ncbi:Uncharacterised protein [Candidatus Anstonella stagnisolia]|nr:Uncharacterised protein [Candidatus Anstonella stagnisolia]
MKSTLLLALIFSFVFLYGCTDKVDAQQYQQAISQRDSYQKQLEDLRLQIPAYESKTSAAEQNYASCLQEKIAAESEASTCKSQLAASSSTSDSRGAYIERVKASTAKYDSYAGILNGYYALFNSSTIPTYSKIVEYEQKLNATNDAILLQKWKTALNCPGDAVCTPLWNAFTSHIKDKMAEGAAAIYIAIKAN